MARPVRSEIVSDEGGFFHVLNRVAGPRRWFPFRKETVRREWMRRLRYCLAMSQVQAASFTLMGNHFHLIVLVDKFRELAREELENLAQARWGRFWKLRTRFWSDQRWMVFNQDVFSLRVFMRDLQGPFATWFNKRCDRRGHLWAGRYKCLALKGLEAVQECLYYIELNPVRAGLTTLPEHWEAGTACLRIRGTDDFLIPLAQLFPQIQTKRLKAYYRAELLYRGSLPGKENQASINTELLSGEEARAMKPGLYLTRRRFLSDGLVLGSPEIIRRYLEKLFEKGIYKRRRDPVPQLGGVFYTLRPQRSHAGI